MLATSGNLKTLCISLLILTACGHHNPDNPQSCPTITGTYIVNSTLNTTQGTCSPKQTSTDKANFDADGNYISPAPDIISCNTAYQCDDVGNIDLDIICTDSIGINAKADIDVVVADGGFTGTATLTGAYQGCTLVIYDLSGSKEN